jgi:hypothetical protein
VWVMRVGGPESSPENMWVMMQAAGAPSPFWQKAKGLEQITCARLSSLAWNDTYQSMTSRLNFNPFYLAALWTYSCKFQQLSPSISCSPYLASILTFTITSPPSPSPSRPPPTTVMGSLVDWETEQLRLAEGLAEEFRAAEILEEDGYRTCIVGDLASVVYGADVVVSDLYIAVADNELQSALKTLLECDYLEEPQTKLQYMGSTAKESNPGWPGYRLRRQPRRRDSVGVLLMPATFWNLDLDGKSFWSDTLLFPRSKYRFPHLEAYMNGKVSRYNLLSQRPSSILFSSASVSSGVLYKLTKLSSL